MVGVFANGPGDLGSISDRVISKTQKWYLMPPCLIINIIRYRSRVKWINPGKELRPPLPWCRSYRKGSLRSPTLLYILVWYQVLQSNNFQIYLIYRWDPKRYFHTGLVDLGVIALKHYSIQLRVSEMEPQYQMDFRVRVRTLMSVCKKNFSETTTQKMYV